MGWWHLQGQPWCHHPSISTWCLWGVFQSIFVKCHHQASRWEILLSLRVSWRAPKVDDVVFRANDEESAYKLYVTSKIILKSASFNLRKFTINSLAIQQWINKAKGVVNVRTGDPQTTSLDKMHAKYTFGAAQQVGLDEQRILGVHWDVFSDWVLFDFSDIARLATGLEPTKRKVVSLMGRFYDPIGFSSPVTKRFKILFQDLCESKVDWDQLFDGKLLLKWKSLIADLQEGQVMSISRC